MPMKRLRFERSSSSFGSLAKDRMWNTRTASAAESRLMERDSVKKTVKQPVMNDDDCGSPIRILTISSSPVAAVKDPKESDTGGGGVGCCAEAFYEKCALCEKKIAHGDDVFMYSYLRAFCSSNCRDKQISMDAKMEITPEVKKDTASEPSREHNAIRLFGVQVEAHSTPQSHIN